MNAASADRSAARINDFLKTFAAEAELAGSLGGRLNRSDPRRRSHSHCAIPQPKPLKTSIMRCPNRSTLKSQLIMATFPSVALSQKLIRNCVKTPAGCWRWQGATDQAGDALVRVEKQVRRGHHVAREIRSDSPIRPDTRVITVVDLYLLLNSPTTPSYEIWPRRRSVQSQIYTETTFSICWIDF